jgi:hypothetical protein
MQLIDFYSIYILARNSLIEKTNGWLFTQEKQASKKLSYKEPWYENGIDSIHSMIRVPIAAQSTLRNDRLTVP